MKGMIKRTEHLLMGVICFFIIINLTGCKSSEVRKVESLIDSAADSFETARNNESLARAISEVRAAGSAYDHLSEKDQQKVDNQDLLMEILLNAEYYVMEETGEEALVLDPDSSSISEIGLCPQFWIENTGVCTYKDITVMCILYDKDKKTLPSDILSIDVTLAPGDKEFVTLLPSEFYDYPVYRTKYFSVGVYDYSKIEP